MVEIFRDLSFRKVGNCRALMNKNQSILLVLGPHFPGVIVASTVILMATLFFHILVQNLLFHVVYMIIAVNLSALSLLFLIMTALKDPGIVMSSLMELNECIHEDMPYCDVCNIYQNANTAHCDMCDVCIDGLDHHCPWIGKCVGKNNKFMFNLFMITWIVYLIYFLVLVTLSMA